MAITLADAKLNTLDDIDLTVIDEFRKSSWLLDNLTFDQAVNPAGGGATLTYGYTRLFAERGAAFRPYNTEYDIAEARAPATPSTCRQRFASCRWTSCTSPTGTHWVGPIYYRPHP